MTPSTTLAAPPRPRERPISTAGLLSRPPVASLASALLLWLAFPPADLGFLAWFALVPLLLLVRSDRPVYSLYLGAWLGGEVFWVLAISWVRLTDPSAWLAWLVMATFLSLWWPVFLALSRLAVRGLGLPLVLAAPVTWVGLDFVRAHVLTGFPWYYLAHAQHAYLPLIQVSDLAGAWGLTFFIALVNACWVDLLALPLLRPTPRGPRLTRPQALRLGVVGTGFLLILVYGAFRLSTAQFREGPKVALLQSNFPQSLKESIKVDEALRRFHILIEKAAPERPDLIVWPETSYQRGFPLFHPRIDAVTLERQIKALHPKGTTAFWKEKEVRVRQELNGLADYLGIPMLVGAITYEFRPDGLSKYNSAILFEPGGRRVSQCYHKLHLVPFGEYVPLIRALPWLTRLTPYHGESTPSLTPGTKPAWFALNGWRFAAAICFEDSVPEVVRQFFTETGNARRPDFLVNLSNDGWFQGSSEIAMHRAISVFRAVEHRVPIARAVNTGGTSIIDGNGAVRGRLDMLAEDILTGVIPLDGRRSLYTACGDWLPVSCLAVTIGLIPISWLQRRRAGKIATGAQP